MVVRPSHALDQPEEAAAAGEGDGVKKTYGELLRDPRWQKRRLEIMSRAEFHCEQCDDGGTTLNVHHKLYRKGAMPWDYTDDELACICENCHKTEHQARESLNRALAEMHITQIEQVLGFAEGLVAKQKVYEDSEEGGISDPDRTWPLRSSSHVRGFLGALWSRIHSLQVEIVGEHGPLNICDVTELYSRGPEMVSIEKRLAKVT